MTYIDASVPGEALPRSGWLRFRNRFWLLTLGSIGVVYGDIGTSPLYAFREAVSAAAGAGGAPTRDAVLGVLSLILWALIVVVTLKYVVILLRADNNGEGGTLALMALAQHALGKSARPVVLLGIISGALFYGDAVITPALSVLSAVEGLKIVTPAFDAYVVPLTVVILIALFAAQSHGTARVAAFFGPITLVWFVAIAIAGLWHIAADPSVLLPSIRSTACAFSRPRHDRPDHARRCVSGGHRRRGALRRPRTFRPSGRSRPPGSRWCCRRWCSTISARARWCWPIPRRSRIRSFCCIPTGRCCRWWCLPPPRP